MAVGLYSRSDISSTEIFIRALSSDSVTAGRIALLAPGLSAEQRFELAARSDGERRGMIAMPSKRRGRLSTGQRFELAAQSTPYWRGVLGYHSRWLNSKQTIALAAKATDWWRQRIVLDNRYLVASDRMALTLLGDSFDFGAAAIYAPGLSVAQRFRLARLASPFWQAKAAKHILDWSPRQKNALLRLSMRPEQ